MRSPMSLLPLRLDHVTFTAGGRRIIDDLSLAIDAGPRTVIVGPNGGGKSVLLRLCHGLLAPTSGSIVWNSVEPAGAPRRQAMVFQRPVLLRRSALANISHALGIAGVPTRIRSERAREALSKVGLERHAAHPARVLSGGEQQRLALARVWALQPEIISPRADSEPRSGRNPRGREGDPGDGRRGYQDVLVTHNSASAAHGEILFLHGKDRGARAQTFFKHPQSVEAARFLEGELPW